MVILVFALLALGSGATTPAVYTLDPSVPLEEQFRLNVPSTCSLVSIDETPMHGSGALNIPAGKHTIVFNYYKETTQSQKTYTQSANGLTITENFEPGYEYNLLAKISGNSITPDIAKADPAEWVALAANESLLSIERPGMQMVSMRIYIDGKDAFILNRGYTRRIIIPNGKHTLSYVTLLSGNTTEEQQGTTEIELTTSSRVVYSVKPGDTTFTKVNTP
jgi:hypothetical protein